MGRLAGGQTRGCPLEGGARTTVPRVRPDDSAGGGPGEEGEGLGVAAGGGRLPRHLHELRHDPGPKHPPVRRQEGSPERAWATLPPSGPPAAEAGGGDTVARRSLLPMTLVLNSGDKKN